MLVERLIYLIKWTADIFLAIPLNVIKMSIQTGGNVTIISILSGDWQCWNLAWSVWLTSLPYYLMLNVCDLPPDGCFTLGAAVGSSSGSQRTSLSICSRPVYARLTAILQTVFKVDSLFLQGIIVIYGSLFWWILQMGGSSRSWTEQRLHFPMMKETSKSTPPERKRRW